MSFPIKSGYSVSKRRLSILASTCALLCCALPLHNTYAAQAGKIVIWVNGDKAYTGIAKLGAAFTAKTGIPVVVEHPDDAASKFEKHAKQESGPDIFIWAHDRIGEWIKAGLLSPVHTSKAIRNSIHPMAWSAVSTGGKTWGYPISMEAIALIYNKDLLPQPPSTFEEIIALERDLNAKGKKAISWDYTNTYFSWPLLAAGGAYAFGHWDAGHYDKSNTGVSTAGAVQGVNTILKLINSGVLPKTANYAEMEKAFHEGKLAMMINGPWAWDDIRKAKINFAVTLIPSVNGKPSAPFVGVQAAMLVKGSPNHASAISFLEDYLLSEAGLKEMNADVPLGVPANRAYYNQLKTDPLIAASMRSVQNGIPMPNNPEMGKFWAAMKTALENISQGKQSTREGLDAAARQILNQPEVKKK